MKNRLQNSIQVYEYSVVQVGSDFNKRHYEALSKYKTEKSDCPYYTLLRNAVRFANYVGVIKIGDLTIEVLPKCDRYNETKETWQRVLLDMLKISLHVEAKTTTYADITIRHHSVIETYLHLFMDEVQKLIHHGLVKKYRITQNNQTALKGKLQFHKHIAKNIVHAERFYVSHNIYDRNNKYNALLYQALQCISSLNVSIEASRRCESLLIDFPECSPVHISEKTFSTLTFDRKTERYKTAIDIARIILLNYHPDLRGGKNNVLAIMFDMNKLWENYIYYRLRHASSKYGVTVRYRRSRPFWMHEVGWKFTLNPDIIIEPTDKSESNIVIDTKWKYNKDISIQDIRQMYAYGKYFSAKTNYLVYPKKIETEDGLPELQKGTFYNPPNEIDSDYSCGLLFVDVLNDNHSLKTEIGENMFEEIKRETGNS